MDNMFTPEYIKEELSKKKKSFISLTDKNVPNMCREGFLKATMKLEASGYFKSNYRIYYYEDYIPMMGKVYRMYVSDLVKITKELDTIDLDAINVSKEELLCSLIAKYQIISIYYDDSNVLAYMSKPYFEIYDGNDIERFFENEIEEFAKNAVQILKDKK